MEYGNHSILTQPAGRGWRGRPKGPGPNRWPALLFAAVACAVLAGCAPRRPEPPAPGPATSAPRAAVPAGAREFEVDPEASVVTMLVRRAGKLSGFGHVHVVTSDGETGRVWFGAAPDLSGFEVRVPVEAVREAVGARDGDTPPLSTRLPSGRTSPCADLMDRRLTSASPHFDHWQHFPVAGGSISVSQIL